MTRSQHMGNWAMISYARCHHVELLRLYETRQQLCRLHLAALKYHKHQKRARCVLVDGVRNKHDVFVPRHELALPSGAADDESFHSTSNLPCMQ